MTQALTNFSDIENAVAISFGGVKTTPFTLIKKTDILWERYFYIS